jgi:hypothetical protein
MLFSINFREHFCGFLLPKSTVLSPIFGISSSSSSSLKMTEDEEREELLGPTMPILLPEGFEAFIKFDAYFLLGWQLSTAFLLEVAFLVTDTFFLLMSSPSLNIMSSSPVSCAVAAAADTLIVTLVILETGNSGC